MLQGKERGRRQRAHWHWLRAHALAVPVALPLVGCALTLKAQELPQAPSALLAEMRNPQTQQATQASQTTQGPQVPSTPTVLLPVPEQTPSQPSVLLPAPAPTADAASQSTAAVLPPCGKSKYNPGFFSIFLPGKAPCQEQDPLQLIVEAGPVRPLTPKQKGFLATRAVVDPFNLITIVGFSGIFVASNAHSAYGPGFTGWGRLIGYSLVEDVQGEFTGTFLLPTVFHEDPRYHRMGNGRPFLLRVEHALIHTVVTQHDDGSLMPNYATLINYPLSAEISNLYVPAVGTNASDTFKRVAVGYATDPVGAVVAEFLPDVAKRIHIHILFAQEILNRIALGQNNGQQ